MLVAVTACACAATTPTSGASPTPIRTTNGSVQVLTRAPTPLGSRTPEVFSGTATVEIGDQFFLPTQITVRVGTVVTWINHGQLLHTATARDNSFGSGSLDFGSSYGFTFAKVGRFPFYCMVHTDMFGEVVVVDAR